MKKRKKPMPPIESDGQTLQCANAQFWPPLEIEHLADTAEELRYTVPDVVYQRIKTWEQACGLKAMDASKCLGCKWVIIDGTPATAPRNGKGIMNKRVPKNHRNGSSR